MAYRTLIEDVAGNREAFESIHADCGKIGASLIGSICGMGYETPLEVWCRMTGRTKKADVTNLNLPLGLWMESAIGKLYEAKTGVAVKPFNKTIQHQSIDWAMASPDFVAADGRLVEAKNRKSRMSHNYENGGMLDSDAIQLQWQMGVHGGDIERSDMAVLCGGDADQFYHPTLEYSPEVFAQLVERAEKFMQMVKSDTPPDAQAGDDELINKLVKMHEAEVALPNSDFEMLERYKELQAKASELTKLLRPIEEEMKATKNQLRLHANGATAASCGNYRIYWKLVERQAQAASSYYRFSLKGE